MRETPTNKTQTKDASMNLVSVWSYNTGGQLNIEPLKVVGGVCVELAPGEQATFELTIEGLVISRAGHSSNCISFHDLLATSEHQLQMMFGMIGRRE